MQTKRLCPSPVTRLDVAIIGCSADDVLVLFFILAKLNRVAAIISLFVLHTTEQQSQNDFGFWVRQSVDSGMSCQMASIEIDKLEMPPLERNKGVETHIVYKYYH